MADITDKMYEDEDEEDYCDRCMSPTSGFPECPFCACCFGWTDRDKAIKECGGIQAALDWRSDRGRGLLYESVACGNIYEDIVFWLNEGADPNMPDYSEHSVLENAMNGGRLKIARLLIRRGADCSKFVDDNLLGYLMYTSNEKKEENRKKTKKCIKKYAVRNMGVNIKG